MDEQKRNGTNPELQTGVLDMPAGEYHRDPANVPSLSSSIAWKIIHDSPLHAWLRHPRLGNKSGESTESTTDGTIAHALLLGKGAERIVVCDFKDFRTDAAKSQRDAAEFAGLTPIIAHKYADRERTAKTLRGKLADRGIIFSPQCAERVFMWVEYADDGTPVQCRAMLDHVSGGDIRDLKTCASAHPKAIQAGIDAYGYHVQEFAYRSAVIANFPEFAGRETYQRIFVELDEPHDVVIDESDGPLRQLGGTLWQYAVNVWARCLKSGEWPGKCPGVNRSTASNGAIEAAALLLEHG